MAFQRSYSKVWWGSDNQLSSSNLTSAMNAAGGGSSFTSGGYYYTSYQQQLAASGSQAHNSHYHLPTQQQQHQHPHQNQLLQHQLQHHHQPFTGSGYHSLDYNSLKMFSGNLSRIQEVDDEQANMSKLSWEKHDSPGSLRSQDSGFSDNDESHSTRSLGGRSSKNGSPSAKSDISRKSTNSSNASTSTTSPSSTSTHTIVTPPTVVRRVGRSQFYPPLVNVSRRISFSGSTTAVNSSIATSVEKTEEKGTQEEHKNALYVDVDTDDADVASPTAIAADAVDTDVIMDQSLERVKLLQQLDCFNLLNSTPKHNDDIDKHDDEDNVDDDDVVAVSAGNKVKDMMAVNDATSAAVKVKNKQKRRRRPPVRTPTKPLMKPMKRRILPKDCSDASDVDDDDDENDNDSDDSKARQCHNHYEDDETKVDFNNSSSNFVELAESELPEMRQEKRKVPAYYNETIYLGVKPYNNETVILGDVQNVENESNLTLKAEDTTLTSFKAKQQRTSTPKTKRQNAKTSQRQPQTITHNLLPSSATFYANPLLNGHTPDLQHWLYELRSSYDHEVMSTLQTKSIAQEAFKNLTITTNTVAKLIRQLQQRALYMQSDFERMERILRNRQHQQTALYDALSSAEQLVANIAEFTGVLERRAVFFSDSRSERKRYEQNLDQIKIITKDTRYSLERHHYINLESLLDDVQVLKRYLLIALRLVFERMVRIIVQSIEYGQCDLMLRANINMIATLTNIDYDGFASLTDAFVQNEAVRTLLIVCLEHKLSSVRALALRALSTICCAPAAIEQLSACDGIEILRDILQVQLPTTISSSSLSSSQKRRVGGSGGGYGGIKRSVAERREAVSLLAQLTAAWHGPDHRVVGLTNCVESIVAGLSQLVVDETSCSQTLLLCAAALNNLSRMEVTSHYSIMSNETIFKLIETVEVRRQQQKQQQQAENYGCEDESGVSIFLYEQIVSMLHNMSLNKKCHSHLANGCIINFITSAYEMEFYKRYDSRAESDAQRRTIKAILHTLTRLVHDSNGGGMGLELLQQQLQEQGIPAILFKLASTSSHHHGVGGGVGIVSGGIGAGVGLHNVSSTFTAASNDQNVGCHQLGRDIELLVKQLELAQQQQKQLQLQQQQRDSISDPMSGGGDGGGGDSTTIALNKVNDEQRLDDFEMSRKTLAPTVSTVGTEGLKFNLTKQESFV